MAGSPKIISVQCVPLQMGIERGKAWWLAFKDDAERADMTITDLIVMPLDPFVVAAIKRKSQ
jgi:hypothetical protein